MSRSSGGLRIILAIGVLAFLFLLATSFGLRRAIQPDERERVQLSPRPQTPFEGARAYADAEKLVALGPRPAGSGAANEARAYVRQAARQAGLLVSELRHDQEGQASLVAEHAGRGGGLVVLAAQLDTRPVAGVDMVGANDGAAPAAVLLELARHLPERAPQGAVWLAWLDGEEGADAWLGRGSARLLRHLREQGRLDSLSAVIYLDSIGDCYLAIPRDAEAPGWLTEIVWDTAQRLGYRAHFGRQPYRHPAERVPLRGAGVPFLLLQDVRYGGTAAQHTQLMHTAEDTMDRVCPGSLQALGDVLYDAIPAVEGHGRTALAEPRS